MSIEFYKFYHNSCLKNNKYLLIIVISLYVFIIKSWSEPTICVVMSQTKNHPKFRVLSAIEIFYMELFVAIRENPNLVDFNKKNCRHGWALCCAINDIY